MQPKKNFTFNISTVLDNTKLNHKQFHSVLIKKKILCVSSRQESYNPHTVPRRHLFSLIAPQQPKNEITAMIAPTTMMMMDPVTYFTDDSST